MALTPLLDSIDELPEALREHYVQVSDGDHAGKWRLDVTAAGGLELASVGKLRKGLEDERGRARGINAELAKLRAVIGEETSLEELGAALQRAKESEDWTPDQKVQERLNSLREQLVGAHGKELKSRDERIEKLTDRLRREVVQAQIVQALAEAGAPAELATVIGSRVRAEVTPDAEFTFDVLNEDGQPAVDGSGNPLQIPALVEEFKKHPTWGKLYAGSNSSGSGANSGAGGGGGGADGQFTMSAAEAREHPQRYYALAEKADAAGRTVELLD